MPIAESAETLLLALAGTTRFLLETLSVGTVLVGLLACANQLPRPWRRRAQPGLPLAGVRLRFGAWLSLALEFQLGADIVATTTTPSGQHLIQLGVVAVIRTFLNLFLARELEAETRLERQKAPPAQGPSGEP
ncbi:DUF1622 domain-containing protein [Vulcanococcus limneticus]|uniref:DUF1622 domain-containing protein n=1 Tax=Vulcanococcus limneticus TaxID=2170428 RepID=UPI00398C18EC